MPVQIQLPGYSHNAPINGLLGVVNAANQWREGSAANDLKAQQGKQLAATTAEQEQKTAQEKVMNENTNKNLKELATPGSFADQLEKGAASAVLKQIDPNHPLLQIMNTPQPMKNPDGSPLLDAVTGQQKMQPVTGLDIRNFVESNPSLKQQVDLTKAKMMAQAAGNKLAPLVDSRNNQLADSIAEHFAKNPTIAKWQKQKDQAQLDLHTLESGAEITGPVKAEIEKGIANFMSGGGSAGLGQTEKMEFNNIYTVLAKGKSFWTGEQQKADPPGYRQYLIDTLHRLDRGADLNIWGAAQRIGQQKAGIFKGNPQADQSLKQSVETYKPSWLGQPEGGSPGQQNQQPQAPQSSQYSPADIQAELKRRGLAK